jgi:trehalose 6-phosphate phosphatase
MGGIVHRATHAQPSHADMRDLLAKSSREVLEQFAWSNVLLAFDYDGTLAPIVTDPNAARMRARTRRLLGVASSLYPITVISGRAKADALKRLEGVGLRGVVGNHGIEPSDRIVRAIEDVNQWSPILEARLAEHKGVKVENKTYSVAVHYRLSREKRRARAAIMDAARTLGELRIVGGKQVVNLLPSGAPHKGIALERERDLHVCDTAIYVGDDETDEDVFLLDQPGRLLTVRVGSKRSSAASYFVRDQVAIDRMLEVLVELRRNRD